MQDLIKYPIGIQDFGEVIRGGYVYVDKTAFIRRLIDTGKYYFLSRPRRFGKSLLLSTIAAYFEGRRDLFDGLAIAETTDVWPQGHPILYLDLSNQTCADVHVLETVLDNQLQKWEEQYDKREEEALPSLRFGGIIQRACEKSQKKVVILVDEYDKPLLDTVGDEQVQEKCRILLHDIYSNLKKYDGCIEFALLTGVTRFSKLSVFSGMNNLIDISMEHQFATLCGITSKELDTYFSSAMKALARKNKMSIVQARARLKRQYDGYRFTKSNATVYNPFSLLKTLRTGEFNDYWFETGTPSFLTAMLMREHINLESITTDSISVSRINSLDPLTADPKPLLYQSGYLTIAGVNPRSGNLYLKFPNEEVERAFLNQLLPLYARRQNVQADVLLDRMVADLDEGRIEDFMREIQALLADVPYEKGPADEYYFRNLLYVIFRLLSFYCEVEHAMAGGRSDIVIKTDGFIYVLELKVDESVEAALRQIEEKGYAAPYAAEKRKLFKIGVNFSGTTKQMDEWRIVEG